MQPLPIDALLGRIVQAVRERRTVALNAAAGAGKTTRVPPALLGVVAGEILVSEPRRLAARLAAHYVARERGEALGKTVGYAVRFESVGGRDTRIRYVTEGVLMRRLLADPTLPGVGAVVLDEFHERHLATDLALALLARLRETQATAPALVVMSATLEADRVAAHLGCEVVQSQGRLHPLSIEHARAPSDVPMENAVAQAVRRVLREDADGDVLVFLPGAREIRRVARVMEPLAEQHAVDVTPLHGDLSIEEQTRAVQPGPRRKVVLSTNVAESSVTIEGVTAVVDTGVARVARHSPWSGLPLLSVEKISRASAIQRAGRAGRLRPGRVIRLYTSGDFETRPEHDTPELLRIDLSEAMLVLHGAGADQPERLPWLDAPPSAALHAAEELLVKLGALDTSGGITELGKRMLAFPVHPRLARIIVEGETRGVAEQACAVAALVAERDIRRAARAGFADGRQEVDASGPSDLLELLERLDEAEEAGFARHRVRSMGLDVRAVEAVRRARRALARVARDRAGAPESLEAEEQALCIAVLSGFPDRVAKRRRPGSRELVLSSGGTANLAPTSVVHDAELMVAVDVEERSKGRSGAATVRLASAISAEWLLDEYPDLLSLEETRAFDAAKDRVELVSRLACGSVTLEQSRSVAPRDAETAALLARAALARGIDAFADHDRLEQLAVRLELLRAHVPELGLPTLAEDALARAVEQAAVGCISLAELGQQDLSAGLTASLDSAQRRALHEQAPERIVLAGGRSVRVHYERGRPPWIASRLQDFFGSVDGPRICQGRVALTLHLLAPNQRAVQVTSDLAGFWARHYPAIRRELMRRYPKHAWPEDGSTARPPEPRPRRR